MNEHVVDIFRRARLTHISAMRASTAYFDDAIIGSITYHGSLNIARVSDMVGPWVATIYFLVSAPHRGGVTSWQHIAPTPSEAIDGCEKLALEWATKLEAERAAIAKGGEL